MQYLESVRKYPLLSREEEQELLERYSKHGDLEARDRLILSNLRLVVNIARRYARPGVGLGDLIEEGNLGLFHALEKFDPDRGVRFATYASWWIRKAILRAARAVHQTVRIPSHMVETLAKARRIENELHEELGREPTMAEVAERLELSSARLKLLRRALSAETTSMEMALGSDGERVLTLREVLPDDEEPAPDEAVFDTLQLEALKRMWKTIDQRQARILTLRYGLDEEGPRSLREVARIVGLSRERVRQIEKEALQSLYRGMALSGYC